MSIRRDYIDTAIGQIHYRSSGDSRLGVPLILLHQVPSSSAMYDALLTELAEDYWMIAPDMPGFGGSDPLPGSITIEAIAKVFHEALSNLGVSQCYLFGHHTGASVAVQLEYDFPGVCKKMALSGPTLLNDSLRELLPTISCAFPVQEDGSHLIQMWQRIRGKDNDAPLSISQRETLLGIELGERYPDAYMAVIAQDYATQLAAIQCPTLIFAGTQDPLYGQLDDALALLSQGTRKEIKDGRTYGCERDADKMAVLLKDFFQ
ncbi:alpha/beta fold hydrolase [Oceanicoccus sp. KOV_DT_Chl]|uniref:alpha/beta fold hydrolase n=1 Tax=Oceanicoccus sp. KOV_DT_Chl TaxID=1904639 RepID=UPI000C7D8A84|nr:alpha/beta hydrolase [Oceanicoccus sp. KOV_DT_Chl]